MRKEKQGDESPVNEATEGNGNGIRSFGIYKIFEIGILGVAFTIIYAFGMIRFGGAIAHVFGLWAGLFFMVSSIAIAMAFLHSLTDLLMQVTLAKRKNDE